MPIYRCLFLQRMVRSAIICILAVGSMASEEPGQRIDKLFEKFSGKSPGCAVGVSQNGKAVFAKGYGMADLEHNVPLSSESRFYMASVSKQFTAMSILLLAEDGKIQLSDSIRKTIPELPDYANGVTLYHLLTHTSGVRDWSDLGSLSGLPPDYVFTDRGVLGSIARQSVLNFEPGTDFLYSNSGYVLLSLVLKRVTQKNLNEFAQERLFVPLEMKSTLFQHDHSALVPGKVFGYKEKDGAWHTSNSMLAAFTLP
jgi:CubicO group peptidase (beta-lactamase class C family)